jgi:methylmalonyl-CoA/ethylmalonyl-CoA epimerase
MTAPLQFDHLGLIVSDLALGRDFLANSLGINRWTAVTDDPGLRVSVQFGNSPHPGPTYELITPFGEDTAASPIANALRQGKHILNHVAYLTPHLAQSGEHLRAQGCFPAAAPQPALAYDGRLVQFWISPLRFIIELIEKPGHLHAFTPPPAEPIP